MADNTTIQPMVGGDVISTDDIAGVKVQRVKVQYGVDGSATDVSASAPLPVTQTSQPLPTGAATDATLAGIKAGTDKIPASPSQEHTTAASPHAARLTDGTSFYKPTTPADTQPVSAASLPLPTGASTAANQSTGNTSLSSIDSKIVTAKTDDYDTGAGTDTVQSMGIALPASGGHVVGGTSLNPLRIDPTGTTTQPVNVSALNGYTPDTNSGLKGNGTQRVVLATDQPQLTNALKVDGSAVTQPISGSVGITGGVTADPTAATAVRYGQATVSVTSTAVQLSNQALTASRGVVVQALAANAGNVVIGDASVTTANGFQLQPGQAVGVAVDNVNRLYVNGTSGDGVCWIGS